MKAKQYKQKTSLQSYKSKIKTLADPGLVQTGFEQSGPELKRDKQVNIKNGWSQKEKNSASLLARFPHHNAKEKLQRFGLNSCFSFSQERPLLTLSLKYKSY